MHQLITAPLRCLLREVITFSVIFSLYNEVHKATRVEWFVILRPAVDILTPLNKFLSLCFKTFLATVDTPKRTLLFSSRPASGSRYKGPNPVNTFYKFSLNFSRYPLAHWFDVNFTRSFFGTRVVKITYLRFFEWSNQNRWSCLNVELKYLICICRFPANFPSKFISCSSISLPRFTLSMNPLVIL